MISLFLNTSSNFLNVALAKDNVVIDELYLKLDKDLSKLALYNIEKLLDKNSILPKDIDEIICVRGPGSFTGLRVGVTISKTFAHFLKKKLYSVSSLYVMATSNVADIIVPIIDARRGYVYGAVYDKDYNVVLDEQYIKLNDLIEKVKSLGKEYMFVSNDDFDIETVLYKPNLVNFFNHMKKREEDPITFIPDYLKKPEAEEKFND